MKKLYLVAPGVTTINGAPVPGNRRMSLTEAEARYDLAHGRLSLAPARRPRAKDPK
ncbi:hypothetical protein [Devosia ginsengisoli]|uniref:hypothetical protein n=1 Tax=Devosia ginsengisoli TaxID=400770 RepID=UPI0026F0BC98|nr:hypothetical protein [Devosia ginsengisoli]MCR6672199.1 hypothetical protein [Devosia ginsengisoli]